MALMAKQRFGGCIALAVLVLGLSTPSQADTVTWAGSGTGTSGRNISASSEFDLTTHDFGAGAVDALRITLSNTSADKTTERGNLLTGLFFALDGVGALPTTSAGFDGYAAVVRITSSQNSFKDLAPAVADTATDGAYQLSNGPFSVANGHDSYSTFRHGIATVGFGLTGFSGKALNGDDYGILAPGSDVITSSLKNALPLIDTTAVFWIARPGTLTSLNQLSNVRFVFGSQPDYRLDGIREPAVEPQMTPHSLSVPLPAASVTGLVLLSAMVLSRWNSRRRET